MTNKTILMTSIIAMTFLVGFAVNNAYATTSTDANDIPSPSQTVDFSQFTGDFSALCTSGTYTGPTPFFNWCFTSGPIEVGQLVGESIEWSSTDNGSVIGDGEYGLGDNGDWDSGRAGYVGTNDSTATMTFDFNDDPICAVGGFVNHAPGVGAPFIMKVLDGSNVVLETFEVSNNAPISTPDAQNDGAFRGIVRDANDIAALELSGEFDVLDDLKFSRACTIPVDIDIKPASDPNSINTKSMGVVPVAILGSATFDVTTVDVTTLMFGNASPSHDLSDPDTYNEHIQDVNEDGFDDLVSHYKQKETGIACGDTEATLTAATNAGTTIVGTDSVNPKGC